MLCFAGFIGANWGTYYFWRTLRSDILASDYGGESRKKRWEME